MIRVYSVVVYAYDVHRVEPLSISGRGRNCTEPVASHAPLAAARTDAVPGYRDTTSSTPVTTTAEQPIDQSVSVSPASR